MRRVIIEDRKAFADTNAHIGCVCICVMDRGTPRPMCVQRNIEGKRASTKMTVRWRIVQI